MARYVRFNGHENNDDMHNPMINLGKREARFGLTARAVIGPRSAFPNALRSLTITNPKCLRDSTLNHDVVVDACFVRLRDGGLERIYGHRRLCPLLYIFTVYSHFAALVLFVVSTFAQITYQNSSGTILLVDNGTFGPPAEEFHYYYNQYPIGLAVSSSGRLFVCYTRGQYAYTLGEAVNQTAGKDLSKDRDNAYKCS
jgi:hypothetical protein